MEHNRVSLETTSVSHSVFQHSLDQFIITAENAYATLQNWESSIETRLSAAEYFIDSRLQQIQIATQRFQEILKTANLQEWRETTETIYQDGHIQTQLLQNTCHEIQEAIQQMVSHYERTATQISKNLAQNTTGLQTTEWQQLIDDSSEEIKAFTQTAQQQMSQTTVWFNWKNLGAAFLLALIVAVSVSLYIEDEWPWEAHKTAVKERVAGQMLITAWPQLTPVIQQQIIDDFG